MIQNDGVFAQIARTVLWHLAVSTLSVLMACGSRFPKTLPSASELGSPLGYRVARGIVHLHTPYSYDACDNQGLSGGVATGAVNEACLSDLRRGLCLNRIDYALATDHPDHMKSQTFAQLALTRTGDTAITAGPLVIGNSIACSDPSGHVAQMYIGYEGPLMAVLMNQHEAGEQSAGYQGFSAGSVTALQAAGTSDALVYFPHTESKSISDLLSFGANGIEIYNLHANLDPKIRSTSLGLDSFGNVLDILLYWIDPYAELEPDLALLSVLEWASPYRTLWNRMLQSGLKPSAVAGSDAHQNVLSYATRDSERVDSFRRLLRWFSNHTLVNSISRAEIKAALAAGRSWVAFEGLGSPVGMNYQVTIGSTRSPVGSTVALAGGEATLTVSRPSLHPSAPRAGFAFEPRLRLVLKRTTTAGQDETVSESTSGDLNFSTRQSGVYRAEVWMFPDHLTHLFGYLRNKLFKEYPWIITNPIYLNP